MLDFADQHKVVNLSIGIMLFIMAFIAPAAMIFPIKKGYITKDAIVIGTTPWAILTGGIGILAIAIIFFAFAVLKKKMVNIVLTIILSIVAIIGISLSIKDYYYITSDHFVSNGPFSYEEKVYDWKDFESVEEILGRDGGSLAVETVILTMKDGTQYEYNGGAMMRMYSTITNRVKDAGGEHIRTEPTT